MNSVVHFRKEDLPKFFMITISALIYAFGMNTFVKSGNLFPGGFAGLSRLISMALEQYMNIRISFSVIYWIANAAVTLLVWKQVGHKFVLLSALWFTLASVFTSVLKLPYITQDPLLIAVFGGLINGTAIGISLRADASSGGSDFISIYLSMRSNAPSWNIILYCNACVLFLAGLMFGWNQALYSIIFQFVSTQVVNTLHQRFKITSLHVVTDHPDEICSAVFRTCRHGITKLACEGGYTGQQHWLLLMDINTYQLKDVMESIKKADEHAFISVSSLTAVSGNYYQKPLE